MRLFIALLPDQNCIRDLLALQEHFAGDEYPFLRLVPEMNLHITLHFLGETDPGRTADLEGLLQRAAGLSRPIAVDPVELSAFPGPQRARGLELTLSCGDRALEELQMLLGRLLRDAGFPTEKRPYKPHITLARVRGRSPRRLSPAGFPAVARPERSYPCRRMLLYRSELGAGGARYRAEGSYSIGTDSEAE